MKTHKEGHAIFKVRILIILMLLGFGGMACSGGGSDTTAPNPDVQPAGSTPDPLSQIQSEGRLPSTHEADRGPVLNSLNVYPPEIDADQDGIPNVPIPNHPEIRMDNCPTVSNPTQEDEDENGVGDACEEVH